MTESYNITPIGFIEAVFKEKFATPRQANLVESAQGRIRMLPPFNDPIAFEGIESCSHVWVQFVFHQNRHQRWQPKVRPPRLGGNQSIGVFATRSPYRPNAVGLSLVTNNGIEKAKGELYLSYSGGDMIDGTPVIDLKPYLPYTDCQPEAVNTLAGQAPNRYPVTFSLSAEQQCLVIGGQPLIELLTEILSLDPRPSYQTINPERTYFSKIGDLQVQWRVLPHSQAELSIFIDAVFNPL